MLIIYTGSGKGKTSACAGQAMRACGREKTVVFGQFFKLPGQAGEQALLEKLLADNFRASGPGFYFEGRDNFADHRDAALGLLNWAMEKAPPCFMLILDEALYALDSGLITEAEVRDLIKLCRKHDTHLVLSGRGLPKWLKDEADLVSEIQEIKHPMASGAKAQAGVEF